jgi:uncharacterized membrane protein
MDFLSIIQLISGVILIFFLPGYLILRLFYKHLKGLEQIVISIGLSISFSIIIALILGFIGIFNYWNSIIAYTIVLVGVITYYAIRMIR